MSRTPTITGLFHVAIKTSDLNATTLFYTKVIGLQLADRPAFDFPGAWYSIPTPVGETIIHIYSGGPVLKADGGMVPANTGAIDHLSLSAIGFDAFRERFETFGLPWRESVVPGRPYWQLFVYDPSGVMLEITFHANAEGRATPVIAADRQYVAGVRFFDAKVYAALKDRLAVPA